MTLKTKLANAVTDEEVAVAAAYFSAVRRRSVIRVIETQTVPKTTVAAWFLIIDRAGGTEPIGERIIEIADDLERFVSRDSRVTFTAYVPPESIRNGRALAARDDTSRCETCHGMGLRGAADVPGIAGRSPTYIFRQLYDFKQRARAGPGSTAMMPIVERLTINDLIALAAYAGSLSP